MATLTGHVVDEPAGERFDWVASVVLEDALSVSVVIPGETAGVLGYIPGSQIGQVAESLDR